MQCICFLFVWCKPKHKWAVLLKGMHRFIEKASESGILQYVNNFIFQMPYLWFFRWSLVAIMMWTVVWRIQKGQPCTRKWRSNMTALPLQQLKMAPTNSASVMSFPPSHTRQFTSISKLAMTLHSSPMRIEWLHSPRYAIYIGKWLTYINMKNIFI